MAGQSRLHGDVSRLAVANLADHHNVGILPQDRPETGREGQPDLRIDLGLADAVHGIFYRVLDGETTEIGGLTFGFVGGGLRTRYHTPYELDDETYAAKVAAVGAVDVLCCHIPPALPELLYDTVARRFERGSEAVLEAIHATRPRYVLFGHVHQPLVRRTRIGRTECVNVGHFRASGAPYVLEW